MNYEERLRAIGKLLDRQDFRDISIMESADGLAVSGVVPLDLRSGITAFEPKTVRLTNALLERAARDAEKRGLFRRG